MKGIAMEEGGAGGGRSGGSIGRETCDQCSFELKAVRVRAAAFSSPSASSSLLNIAILGAVAILKSSARLVRIIVVVAAARWQRASERRVTRRGRNASTLIADGVE